MVSTFRMPPLKLKKPTLSNVDPLCTVSVPPLRLKVLELDMAVASTTPSIKVMVPALFIMPVLVMVPVFVSVPPELLISIPALFSVPSLSISL